ncbi:hypothetical protein LINPERPRIM_LOCUS26569 [Linum perenne]
MQKDEILENVMATINGVIEKIVPKKWGGVRSLHLKLLDSLALPLYETVPDLKLKIESQKVEVEEEEEKEKENVEYLKAAGTKKMKKKGRISEIRYMDSKGDAVETEQVESDAALVSNGDDKAVVKKRKKVVKDQDETRTKKAVGKGKDETSSIKLKRKKKKVSE